VIVSIRRGDEAFDKSKLECCATSTDVGEYEKGLLQAAV
jgi:hypothetical protein